MYRLLITSPSVVVRRPVGRRRGNDARALPRPFETARVQPTQAALGLDPEPLGETEREEKEAAEQQGAAVERRARAVTAGAGQEAEA